MQDVSSTNIIDVANIEALHRKSTQILFVTNKCERTWSLKAINDLEDLLNEEWTNVEPDHDESAVSGTHDGNEIKEITKSRKDSRRNDVKMFISSTDQILGNIYGLKRNKMSLEKLIEQFKKHIELIDENMGKLEKNKSYALDDEEEHCLQADIDVLKKTKLSVENSMYLLSKRKDSIDKDIDLLEKKRKSLASSVHMLKKTISVMSDTDYLKEQKCNTENTIKLMKKKNTIADKIEALEKEWSCLDNDVDFFKKKCDSIEKEIKVLLNSNSIKSDTEVYKKKKLKTSIEKDIALLQHKKHTVEQDIEVLEDDDKVIQKELNALNNDSRVSGDLDMLSARLEVIEAIIEILHKKELIAGDAQEEREIREDYAELNKKLASLENGDEVDDDVEKSEGEFCEDKKKSKERS